MVIVDNLISLAYLPRTDETTCLLLVPSSEETDYECFVGPSTV